MRLCHDIAGCLGDTVSWARLLLEFSSWIKNYNAPTGWWSVLGNVAESALDFIVASTPNFLGFPSEDWQLKSLQ